MTKLNYCCNNPHSLLSHSLSLSRSFSICMTRCVYVTMDHCSLTIVILCMLSEMECHYSQHHICICTHACGDTLVAWLVHKLATSRHVSSPNLDTDQGSACMSYFIVVHNGLNFAYLYFNVCCVCMNNIFVCIDAHDMREGMIVCRFCEGQSRVRIFWQPCL